MQILIDRFRRHRHKAGVFLVCGLAVGASLGLAAVPRASAQSAAQSDKVRKEWAETDEQRAERRRRAHALEQDWSRGLWVVRNPLFFSSYKSVDEYLSGKKAPDAAPLNAEYQQKAQALLAEGRKNREAVDPLSFVQHLKTMGASFNQDPNFVPLKPFDVVCPFYGYPLELVEPNPMKWEFAPTKIFQLFSGDSGVSRLMKSGVSTEGWKGGFRFPATTIADGQGWAFAHWEGDVLTIETSHISYWYQEEPGFVIEVGVPHSDKLQGLEKWRQTGPDTLELELTLTDTGAFTKPWTVKKIYDRTKGNELVELRDRQCH